MERNVNIKLAKKFFPKRAEIDTVRDGHNEYDQRHDVLTDAFSAWHALEDLRIKERRHERYVFGDQWGDRIVKDGLAMTERTNILDQGNVALQNNRIRNIVRTVVGQFQNNQTEPVCVSRERDEQERGEIMSNTIQYVYQNNQMWDLDTLGLYSLLISGLPVFRSEWGRREDRWDVWTDNISLERFIVDNNMKDPRAHDCHLVGALWDMSLNDVLAKFATNTTERDKLLDIYSTVGMRSVHDQFTSRYTEKRSELNFHIPENNQCRVIEVWRKESKERLECWDTRSGDYYKHELDDINRIRLENQRRMTLYSQKGIEEKDMRLIKIRWFIDNYWYFYFLSPRGDVLKEGETPFWHKSHPFSFKMYPQYNGKVYPFVGDFIDQQRYINRYMMLYDFIIRNSAKGVLVAPRELLQDYTKEMLRDEWTRVDGLILYNSSALAQLPNAKIEQIKNASVPVGVTEMIAMQVQSLEAISGVSGALQGQTAKSGTPSSLYLQQSQNSSTSLTEIFESFRGLREARDIKNLKLIQQYYTEERSININGGNGRSRTITYTPLLVRDVEFDLSITESQSTPVFRQMMNDMLFQFWQGGAINLKQMLENGAFPFADKLLQSLESDAQEGDPTQGGVPQIDPETAQQVYGQADPQAMAMIKKGLAS
ncbi:MAG: hypothetical protein JJE08_06825 [Proteiniphilum sp.]|nr:hypothetical protein [Proteiniphilum sp.]